MEIINGTPYAMERGVIFDRIGNETLLVVIKGTFDFFAGGTQLAEEQVPVVQADEYYGDPTTTSIRVATDMLPLRPGTGITLQGQAVSTNGPVRKMNVGIKIGELSQKAVVFGDRLGFDHLNSPEAFERMPLTWENAFGGYDTSNDNPKRHDAMQQNPIGKGFMASRSKLSANEVPLPNIEHPGQRLRSPFDKVPAVGFGPVAPAWLNRRQFAGTYDKQWEQERMPLLPDDFDDRFLQAAPPELTANAYLQGNQPVVLLGMTEEGRVSFDLDAPAPVIGVRFHQSAVRSKPKLESIHFDTEARQVQLIWKSCINIQGKVESFSNVEARLL